ncbi:NIMA interactive protein [Pyrenophora tritici-repentis]|nr:NIMA interactive protein [Pyrenophora tritici-repentis]KAI0604838.1 NIMA interactive protein [Pyrenophora tritici-repentis]KAI0617113.1 NIMA interactive protein [Pyrenophora tritici-repentis]KAI1541743.1 NIMA interactive protein [Pyrenophora tritici-repentis]KAI1569081.1 NIMA interactive protein [Pyrenophora tritici-repentis]
MESYNLKTASTYINNLLLARGLLRNGKPIEFAHPSRGEGGKEATMAQIINLVHDLILKRDRDHEYRESIAETLRSLRSESTRQTAALEKQHNRNADLSRQLSLAQAQEQSARKALQTAESSARKLRAEMQRLKTTVDQVRTSCTNDVRKRDREISRLKSHLTSQQRGNKTGLVGASITINPGSVGLGTTSTVRDEVPNVDDPEYSLKQETTEFLTHLSQSLSDENDNLIGLVRSTLLTLRELQGMSEQNGKGGEEDASVLDEDDDSARQGMLHALPTNYETLADDMDTVLDNLKNLLTNPNFVSVEEVEMREEEIHRLRAGWEKMEARLRESFILMDSWRKRMTNGDTINLEELRMGLVFDEDVDDSDEQREQQDTERHLSPRVEEAPERTKGPDMFKIKLQPSQSALGETSGNKSPRKVAFSPSIPNTPSQVENENADASGIDLVGAEKPSRPSSAAKPPQSQERASRQASRDGRAPRHTKKRLSSPHAHPDEPSPKLKVKDKLREAAEAAAVTDGQKFTSPTAQVDDSVAVSEDVTTRRAARSPVRTRVGGRPKRRKSTLTPEELANLLGC